MQMYQIRLTEKEFIISFVVLMSLRIFIGGILFSRYIMIGKEAGLIICASAIYNLSYFSYTEYDGSSSAPATGPYYYNMSIVY